MVQQRTPQSASLIAILALFAMIATGCGAVVTANSQRDAVIEIGPTPAPVPNGVSTADPAPPTGHEYGATLDEWTDTEQQLQESASAETTSASTPSQSGYAEIDWDDLIPAGASGEELIARFEEQLAAVEPGSEDADILYAEIQAAYDPEAVDPNLDGEKIRLAGFVAPLTYDGDIVTEFLLVPTFGACIHVPPPPPNQTVMVSLDKENGLTLDDTWGAVWVEGTMEIESGTTDLGSTSYRITNATSGSYTDF